MRIGERQISFVRLFYFIEALCRSTNTNMPKENIEMEIDGTDVDVVPVHSTKRNIGYFIGRTIS